MCAGESATEENDAADEEVDDTNDGTHKGTGGPFSNLCAPVIEMECAGDDPIQTSSMEFDATQSAQPTSGNHADFFSKPQDRTPFVRVQVMLTSRSKAMMTITMTLCNQMRLSQRLSQHRQHQVILGLVFEAKE